MCGAHARARLRRRAVARRPPCCYCSAGGPALAAPCPGWLVTTTADSGAGSLRECIKLANGSPGQTISVPAGTYTLTIFGTGEDAAATGDLDLTANMSIVGAGSGTTIIRAGTNSSNGIDRVFDVRPGVTASISGATVRFGQANGGIGGGISNSGNLTLSDVIVENNGSGSVGGGIGEDGAGTLTLTNVTVSGNNSSNGGGLYLKSSGLATFTDVTIDANVIANNGRGLYLESGSLVYTRGAVSNHVGGANGAGLYFKGSTVTLTDLTVSGNTASGPGGGIYNETTTTTITGVTVNNNQAANGGGLYVNSGNVTIENSTFRANTAGTGAGIEVANNTTTLTNVTLSAHSGTALRRGGGTLQAKNTIAAGSSSNDCNGTITSLGGNLDTDGSCGFALTANPLLGALQDNGGPTFTQAPGSGSPAIDAATGCPPPAVNQRGAARPSGLACDIGAYEVISLSVSGRVFEDLNYGGGAGRDFATAAGVVRSGARVELYDNAGAFVTSTTTDGSGNYSFSGLSATSYAVRVVSSSVSSSRSGYVASLRPVMTYRTNASSGSAVAVTDYVGGQDPATADAGNAASGWILNTGTGAFSGSGAGKAHAFAPVTIGAASVTGVDFGWNFDAIVNKNNSGQGSLRQAISNANTLGGDAALAQSGRPAGIENAVFMISNGTSAAGLRAANNYFSAGVATIAPTSALPTIGAALVLDAQTQPGWTASPIIELNGAGAGAGSVKGLTLGSSSSGSTIRGLIVNRFSGTGVEINASSNDTIQGNWIGLSATGLAAAGNAIKGLYATNSTGHLIGGTTASARNVISGNGEQGIYFDNVNNSTISGNYIGTDVNGTGDVNGAASDTLKSGIYLGNGSSDNLVGGTSANARNVLSGNNHYGFEVLGATSQNNLLQGNYIGTTASGLAALGNTNGGASFWGAGTGNVFGGGAGGAGNVISGNLDRGVLVGSASNRSHRARQLHRRRRRWHDCARQRHGDLDRGRLDQYAHRHRRQWLERCGRGQRRLRQRGRHLHHR